MPMFLPFKRAGMEEKTVQALAFPAALLLGLLTLFPLAMMLVLSFGDPYDWWQNRRWPDLGHLISPRRFYSMYLVHRYDYWPSLRGFNAFYGTRITDADTIVKYDGDPKLAGNWRARAKDGVSCLREAMPWTHYEPLYDSWEYFKDTIPYSGYTGLAAESWKKFLKKRYGDIARVNKKFQTDYPSFGHIRVPESIPGNRRSEYLMDQPWMVEYQEFMEKSLKVEWKLVRLEKIWYRGFLQKLPEISGGVDRLNAALGTSCSTWDDLEMEETAPASPKARVYWEKFVRGYLNPFYLEILPDENTGTAFNRFLSARHGSPASARTAWGTAGSDAVVLPETVSGAMQSATTYSDWDGFVRTLPAKNIRVRGPMRIWHRYVAEKYQSIGKLNEAYGTSYGDFAEVAWPQAEIDMADWKDNRFFYIFDEVFKNYRRAWSFIAEITPSLRNTLRFSLLFTLLAVFINTGAGYILSRYARGPMQMLIIYFLALAAFPIEAMAVPNFILLRKMGLLNTVWALVLPMAVNGYYIYLLKNTFDSISSEYYENAVMEGAGHWTLFWNVGYPFARPMISVVAVYAFIWSYSNFMWALIVAQKNTEVTLPIYLFSLGDADMAPCLLGAIMIIATLPPLAMFIFANRILQKSLSLPK